MTGFLRPAGSSGNYRYKTENCGISQSRKGSASALMILVLTVLVLLGVLSLVTVASEYRLASRRAAWQQGYFAADLAAVEFLAALDQSSKTFISSRQSEQITLEELAVYLNSQTWQPSVQDLEIIADGQIITVSALVGPSEAEEGKTPVQMIETGLTLEIIPDSPELIGIDVIKWSQWQQAPAQITDQVVILMPD